MREVCHTVMGRSRSRHPPDPSSHPDCSHRNDQGDAGDESMKNITARKAAAAPAAAPAAPKAMKAMKAMDKKKMDTIH